MLITSSYHYHLYESKEFSDVTLVSDDYQSIDAHKTLLAHSSSIFRTLLHISTDQKPIIYLKGVSYNELLALVKLIYLGEELMEESELSALQEVANEYKVCHLNSSDARTFDTKTQKMDFLSQPNVQDIGTFSPTKSNKLNFLNFDSDSVELDKNASTELVQKHTSLENQESFDIEPNSIDVVRDNMYTNFDEVLETKETSHEGSADNLALQENPANAKQKKKNKKAEEESECKVCAKTFTTVRSLQRHTKYIHELAFSEKCKFCDKIFYNRDSIRPHVQRRHEPAKYICCDKCDWKWKNGIARDLKRHKIRFHQPACEYCKITFEKEEELHFHIEQQHINKYF